MVTEVILASHVIVPETKPQTPEIVIVDISDIVGSQREQALALTEETNPKLIAELEKITATE